MPQNLGRNDLCWCGSGRKYKKCHLDRASQSALPFAAVQAAMRADVARRPAVIRTPHQAARESVGSHSSTGGSAISDCRRYQPRAEGELILAAAAMLYGSSVLFGGE